MDCEATVDTLAETLRPHYSHFLSRHEGETLLTGHSHQAWPDVARDAQLEAFDDAAQLVDDKWSRIFGTILPEFQTHVARRIGSSRPADLAIAPNTHELVYRLLSCFAQNARIVTTEHEFHSLSRQLRRLEEDELEVARVTVHNKSDEQVLNQLIRCVDADQTDLVALSYVFFDTSRRFTELPRLLRALHDRKIPCLVDVYHAFNVVPFQTDEWPGSVFVTGGGYKYAQGGEGACWMLLPEDAKPFRPRQTGWFASFDELAHASQQVNYGAGGQRFLGATFDATALYRGRAVFQWMEEHKLTVERLHEHSLSQTEILMDAFSEQCPSIPIETPRDPSARGGFVSLRVPDASKMQERLKAHQIWTDARGDMLRFGPAPYLSSEQLKTAARVLSTLV